MQLVPLISTVFTISYAVAKMSVDPDRNQFVDSETGYYVLFHGTAVENAAAPAYLADQQLDMMKQWGFNVLRVGFHWHLYETAPGVWNETYLERVADLVKRVGERDMLVFLDMHQDSWSPLYCDGHGIPWFYATPSNDSVYWAPSGNLTFPWPIAEPAYSEPPDCYDEAGHWCHVSDCSNVSSSIFSWAGTYATAALSSGAQRLYSDETVTRAFLEFWMRVAKRFRQPDVSPHILAYELINEPWLGDIYANVSLLIPGEADRTNLQPFYDTVSESLRETDPDTILFFEPATGGNILDAPPTGLSHPPGGMQHAGKSALSYHIYCLLLEADMPVNPHPGNSSTAWLEYEACEWGNNIQFDVRHKDVKKLRVAGFLSEFGAVREAPQTIDVLRYTTRAMDDQLTSWAYWLITPSMNSSHPNWEPKWLSRTYPRRTPGPLVAVNFNDSTGHFNCTFQPSSYASIGASSSWNGDSSPALVRELEMYGSSEFYYPHGIEWTASPAGALSMAKPFNASTGLATFALEEGVTSDVTLKVWPRSRLRKA